MKKVLIIVGSVLFLFMYSIFVVQTFFWSRNKPGNGRQSKKLQIQGAQSLRNEEYLLVRRND